MPTIKSMTCPSCGAPLTNLKSATGVCDSCHTPYVIEEMQNCQNVIQKECIKSGIGFDFYPENAERSCLNLFPNGICPDDIFEEAEITAVNYYYVPAYYYHYNASASFMVDITRTTSSTGVGFSGGHVAISGGSASTKVATSGTATADIQGITSGRNNYIAVISKLYNDKYNYLTDAESLEINPDIQTLSFDSPESSIIDSTVRPAADSAIHDSALAQLKGRATSNLTLGNINLSKNNVDKILVGVCDVTMHYRGDCFHVYSDSTGAKVCGGGLPVDSQKKEKVDALNKFGIPDVPNGEKLKVVYFRTICRQVPSFSGMLWILSFVLFVLAIVLFICPDESGLFIIGDLVSLILALLPFVFYFRARKKMKEYKPLKAEFENDRAKSIKIKDDFKNSGRYLKGYEKFFKK